MLCDSIVLSQHVVGRWIVTTSLCGLPFHSQEAEGCQSSNVAAVCRLILEAPDTNASVYPLVWAVTFCVQGNDVQVWKATRDQRKPGFAMQSLVFPGMIGFSYCTCFRSYLFLLELAWYFNRPATCPCYVTPGQTTEERKHGRGWRVTQF